MFSTRTDYYSIIAKAVSALDRNTEDARRGLYQRARSALNTAMHGADPTLNPSDILVAQMSLEEAIGRVEAEARRDRRALRPKTRPSNSDQRNPRGDETDSGHGRDNWLSEVLARASRENYGWGDDERDLTRPRELGRNR